MATIPVTRAPALPTGDLDDEVPGSSPYLQLRHHARTRGDDVAFVVATQGSFERRSWAEVTRTVEQAAAGLIRSGLRADQVVLNLLPPTSAYPELDLALRVIGAVVVHVSPDASGEDLVRELGDVAVRLVVSESEDVLHRLNGLRFSSAELFAIAGGAGWRRLLSLGAERLTMDPTVVERADRVVDPAGAVPRILRPGAGLARLAPAGASVPVLRPDDVSIVVGHPSDPVVQVMREAHLASGSTLSRIADAGGLYDLASAVTPSVLATSEQVEAAMPLVCRRIVAERGVRVVRCEDVELAPADLPVPPPVVMGDPSLLPRRARQAPGRDFQLDTERAVRVQPEESAFQLPSLPLFGGESVLDQLLLSQARQGRP